MAFDHFFESLDNVPPELQRNFTLMTDLDRRTSELMQRINECIIEYKNSSSKNERLSIKRESNELFTKLNGYSDDKVELALQTYELIDKNIRRLTSLQPQAAEDCTTEVQPIGFDMPLDPNEPRYCICRGVSYGDMVACDNRECALEWFHYTCVGLTSAPKGKWYCGQCMVKRPKSRSRKSRRH